MAIGDIKTKSKKKKRTPFVLSPFAFSSDNMGIVSAEGDLFFQLGQIRSAPIILQGT